MGCGMSRSNLMDGGMTAFGNHNVPVHNKTDNDPPKLLIKDTSIVHQPPTLQKINTTDANATPVNHHDDDGDNDNDEKGFSNPDPMWFGSPSFREYVQMVPDDDDDDDVNDDVVVTTTGDEPREEIVIGTQRGENLACNGEICVWRDSKETEQVEKKESRVGRFRKVFQVHRATHRATFWHGRAWHAGHGHPKATRKAT